MSAMKSLRIIDASYNNLTDVGQTFDTMPFLESLNLSHNPNLKEAAMSERIVRLVLMVRFVFVMSSN
jgi:hypothetical protein